MPSISVIGDGQWSKRSYGHSYNANSGAAVLIGSLTKKLIYLGVKNKFCIICKKNANKDHICFKNWNYSSSEMEGHLIKEGFEKIY